MQLALWTSHTGNVSSTVQLCSTPASVRRNRRCVVDDVLGRQESIVCQKLDIDCCAAGPLHNPGVREA